MGDAFRADFYRSGTETGIENGKTGTETGIQIRETGTEINQMSFLNTLSETESSEDIIVNDKNKLMEHFMHGLCQMHN